MPEKEKAACYEHAADGRLTSIGVSSSAPEYTLTNAANLVRVLRITPARVTSEVKAFVTVIVGHVQIAGIRVLVPLATGRPRVEFPKQQAANGEQWPLVTIADPALREFVEDAILATWRDTAIFQAQPAGRPYARRR